MGLVKQKDGNFAMSHSDIVKVRGGRTLTEKINDVDAQMALDVLSSDNYSVTSAATTLATQPRKKLSPEFEVGKTYIVEASIDAAFAYTFWVILYSANDKGNTRVALVTFNAGETSKTVEYTPQQGTNYQWVGVYVDYANQIGNVHLSYREKAYIADIANKQKALEQEVEEGLDSLANKMDKYAIVNSYKISDLTVKQCCIASAGKWYKAKNGSQSHTYIEVTPGHSYMIHGTAWQMGWLKGGNGGYDTAAQPTSGDSVPFVNGTSVLSVADGEIITAPTGASYLGITLIDSGDLSVPIVGIDEIDIDDSYEFRMANIESKIDNIGTAGKIRYAHWNVGHFTYYDGHIEPGSFHKTPNITEANSPAMQLRYKKMLDKVHADIIGICEYDERFDAKTPTPTPTKSTIFGNYKYQFEGTRNGYPCNSIFSNIAGTSIGEVNFTDNDEEVSYFKVVKFLIGGVEVLVVETHLDWNHYWETPDPAYNDKQVAQLLAYLADFDHVILSADFNVDTESQYDAFTNAGFTLVNGGYLGYFSTMLERGDAANSRLDNIIVKGFDVSNIKVWDESGYALPSTETIVTGVDFENETITTKTIEKEGGLSDHSMISCDLTLIP